MVDEIIEEYHGIIGEADFLSDATKQKAMAKLDSMGKGILWPDDWAAYEYKGLSFQSAEEGGTLSEALDAIREYQFHHRVEQYTKPVDKTEWLHLRPWSTVTMIPRQTEPLFLADLPETSCISRI